MKANLDIVSRELVRQFGPGGELAARNLDLWLSGAVPLADTHTIEKLLREDALKLLYDSFWMLLPFGTGGRRGNVGYGPNRINPSVVAMTVQGHCDYLLENSPPESLIVVVANDVRVFRDWSRTYTDILGTHHPLISLSSRALARLACEVYAGNGITAYCAEPDDQSALMTTPFLSFAIRSLGAAGGVNLSASHNPPDDNGIKVYDHSGAQPIPPHDQNLADRMATATQPRILSFSEARRRGLIRPVPSETGEAYLATYASLLDANEVRSDVPIVYTPLCGAGLDSTGRVLNRLHFPVLTPADQYPDGQFRGVPLYIPNPEVPEATRPAQLAAERAGSSIVLSTDPDADRLGVDVRSGGEWIHLDGNQIAAILAYYLMRDEAGPKRRGLVIETLVTTKLVAAIARSVDNPVIDTLLVGFKYIADVLAQLETKGHFLGIQATATDLVLAAEESHGVLVTSTIRDKDAAGGALFLAALHQRLVARGSSLYQYYLEILEHVGAYHNVSRSIMLKGPDGFTRRDEMMKSLRKDPPLELAGAQILRVRDHWDVDLYGKHLSATDTSSRDLMEFDAERFRIVVRPSGTEPIFKLYCELLPVESGLTGHELLRFLQERAWNTVTAVYRELLLRIGIVLDAPALALPDFLDLELKLKFQRESLPEFERRLFSGGFKQWEAARSVLESVARKITNTGDSGSGDPTSVLKPAIRSAASRWPADGPEVLSAIREWASSDMP